MSLKTVKYYGGHFSRWLLLLQQFQFTVRYKPGGSNGNVDGLSRRPPPVENNTFPQRLTRNEQQLKGILRSLHLYRTQNLGAYQVLQEVKIALQQDTTLPRQFQGKRDKLVQKEGVLYYRQTDSSPLQTVVPYSLQ